MIEEFLNNQTTVLANIEKGVLRKDSLLKILKEEFEKSNNIDLLRALNKGVVEMMEENKKIEFLEELKFTINILEDYQESSSLNIWIIPSNINSKDLAEKYERVILILKGIIS